MARRLLSYSCSLLFSALFLAVLPGLSGCGGSSKPIRVTIAKPASTTIDPGDSVSLTASVANDSSNAGVAWTLAGTGCTGSACGALSNNSKTSVTYTAPGTVTTAFTVTITATSKTKATQSTTLTLNIPANPAITTALGALIAGQVGSTYSVTVALSGGISPYTWSVKQGSLPTGLTLGASSGTISGIPTVAGSYTFTLLVTDSGSPALTASGQFSITVATAPAIVFSTTTLANATYKVAYTASVAATGGAGTLTYQVSSGSLPAGLSMSSAGAISGTPTAAGTANFTVTASDAYGDSAQQSLSILVNYPAIVISPATLPGGQYITAYSQNLSATGGSGSGYVWTVTSGAASLTAVNLSVSGAGAIAGTPQAVGNASFTVQVKDSYGDTQSASYTIAVTYPALSITTGAALPAGMVGVSYGPVTLAATGGSGTGYAWTVTGGTALSSAGLTLSSGGVISGTPTAAVAAGNVTIQVEDSASNKASATFTLTVYAALTITSSTLPNATYGEAYTASLAATGGDGSTLAWSTTSGTALTAVGLSLSSAGQLSGTPPSPQNAPLPNCQSGKAYCLSLSISVADSDNSAFTTTTTVALTVVYPALAVTTTTLPSGVINTLYSQSLAASGGSGTGYTWTVTTGQSSLGALNLTLSAAGLLSGTPTSAGSASFGVQVKDSMGNTATASLSVTINASLSITTTALPYATTGTLYSQQLAASGGTGTDTWSTTGSSNLSTFNLTLSSSGLLSGTPSSTGTVSFTAQVKDSSGDTATEPYSFAVYGPLSQNSTSLPLTGTTSVAYSGMITAVGGSGNYSWTVTGLSDNLTQSASGATLTISGTPSSASTVPITVKLTDTTTTDSVSNNYSIVISNPSPLTLPSSNPSSLPSATVTTSYAGFINASGGVGPYTWKINGTTVTSSGVALSDGLGATSTGGNTLSVSGTPTATGTVTLTSVTITDSESTPVTAGPYTYTIAVNPVSTLQITNYGVPQGMVNMPYTFNNLNITGGEQPYTVTYTNLPAGLSQESGTWSVAGIPQSSGSTTVTVKVTDSSTPTAQTQSTTFTLPVVPETVATKNSELKGQYACYLALNWDGGVVVTSTGNTLYRGGAVFALAVNGSGAITGGEIDTSTPSSGYSGASANGALSGSYAVGADNRGYIILNLGGPNVFAISGGNLNSSSVFSEFALTVMDDVGPAPDYPSGHHGGGHCYLQNTTGLSGSLPSGGNVFATRGEDIDGNLEAEVGYANFTSSTLSGVLDAVDDGVYSGDLSFSGSVDSTADSFGRVTFTSGISGHNATPLVMYLTNNSAGEGVLMSGNSHNAASNANFWIGETRAQVAAHVSAAYPLNGPIVLYDSGLDSSVTSFKSEVAQAAGSSSAATLAVNADLTNDAGTLKFKTPGTVAYSTNATTGRTTLTVSGEDATGDVWYIYDTNRAVVLFADTGSGGGTTAQDTLGWIEPQTVPTADSGQWAVGDLSTSYFMTNLSNGDDNTDWNTGAFTVTSGGALQPFAEDDGGQSWADWDEGLSGESGESATGSIVLDDTYGTYGVFDINVTQGGTTGTQVYCVAISVDKATDSSTRGRLICIDGSSSSPKLTLVQE